MKKLKMIFNFIKKIITKTKMLYWIIPFIFFILIVVVLVIGPDNMITPFKYFN